MVRLALVFLLFGGSLSVHAQERIASPTAKLEELKAIQPEVPQFSYLEYDFGKIQQHKPVTHTFYFKNTTGYPIAIKDVQVSCGCTTPSFSRDTIPPGGTGSISLGYNAADAGSFVKPVTVVYDNEKTQQLILKGEVWQTAGKSAPENAFIQKLNKKQ